MKGVRSEMPSGPRGGKTTISGDRVRKNLWITIEESEALRRRAFETRQTETTIIRRGLRQQLGLSKRRK